MSAIRVVDKLAKQLKMRVVLGDQHLVIKDRLQKGLERLKAAKVDHPVMGVEIVAFKGQRKGQRVAVDKPAMAMLGAMLPKGAGPAFLIDHIA